MIWYIRRNKRKAHSVQAYATRLVLPTYENFIKLVVAISAFAFLMTILFPFDQTGTYNNLLETAVYAATIGFNHFVFEGLAFFLLQKVRLSSFGGAGGVALFNIIALSHPVFV